MERGLIHNSHPNAGDHICSVEERDVPCPADGRVPGHDNQVQVNEDIEHGELGRSGQVMLTDPFTR